MSAEQVILAALAAGAGAGLTDTTSAVVRDAYTSLKSLLKYRFGSRDTEAVEALEANETEPGAWQVRIGEALTTSGAADDEQILEAARTLLAAASPQSTGNFHIGVGTNHGVVGGQISGPMTFNQAPPVPPAPPER